MKTWIKVFSKAIWILVTSILFLMVLGFSMLENEPISQSNQIEIGTITPVSPETLSTINSLVSNENCLIPCWWGLMLGESNFSEVNNFISLIDGDGVETWVFQGKSITSVDMNIFSMMPENLETWMEFPPDYATLLSFRLDNEKDQLSAIALLVSQPEKHAVDWSPYTPSQILATYGVPDVVGYSGSVWATGEDYHLYFRYPSIGLYIDYGLKAAYLDTEDYFILCNQMDDVSAQISLWLESEELDLESLGLWEGARYGQYERDLQDITGLSLSEFTDAFSAENACIATLPRVEWRDSG